jgi:hypothetical protein
MTGCPRVLLALLAPPMLAACSGGGKAPATDQDDALCALREDAGATVAATEDEADAPALAVDGGPYTVALAPNQVRFAKLTLLDAATVLLYASDEDVLTGLLASGAQVPLVLPEENPYCPEEIPAVYALELEAGDTLLRLGPTDATSAWFAPVAP